MFRFMAPKNSFKNFSTLSIIFTSALILLPQYWIVSPDNESFISTFLSTYLQAQALKNWSYPFWTSMLGIGMPQPFSQYLYFHPLLFLFMFLPPDIALLLMYFFHLLVGTFSVRAICKEVGVNEKISLVCSLTFLLCATTINYTIVDFWPSVFAIWTSLPLVFYLIIRLIAVEGKLASFFFSISLGLSLGIMILNAHASIVPEYFLCIILFVVGFWRRLKTRIWWIVLSFCIGGLIAASKIFYHNSEYSLFPLESARTYVEFSLFNRKELWNMFLKPFYQERNLTNIFWANFNMGMRVVWFGGIFALSSIAALLVRKFKHEMKLPLGLVFLGGLALIHLPKAFCFKVIAFLVAFRDPAILAGIILAGLFLTYLYNIASECRKAKSVRYFSKLAIIFLCCVHLILMVTGAAPFWLRNVSHAYVYNGKKSLNHWFGLPESSVKWNMDSTDLVNKIIDRDNEHPGRLYYSQQVERKVVNTKYRTNGLWTNSLAFHGIGVINGYFKGIYYGDIYPTNGLMHSSISAQPSLLRSPAMLTLLGVTHVIALEGELVSPSFVKKDEFELGDGIKILIYDNPEAFPEAFVVPDKEYEFLPRRNCEHNRFLCKDVSGFIGKIDLNKQLSVEKNSGNVKIGFPPADKKQNIVVSEYYRPGWQVQRIRGREEQANLFPFNEVLIGVTVPAGTQEIVLSYRPRIRVVLESISWLGIVVCIIALFMIGIYVRKTSELS